MSRMTLLLQTALSHYSTSAHSGRTVLFGLMFWSSILASSAQAQSTDVEKSQSTETSPKPVPTGEPVFGKPVGLLANALEQDWHHFSSREDVNLQDVWKIVDVAEEKQLICVGNPKGFLFTKREFKNFELTFEWMYPSDPNGNSGVLIYTKEERRLWPTSMQVQLHQPQAGALFAGGDATSNKPFDAGLAGKIGEWNKCKIVSINGRLSVEINDQKAGQAEGCKPSSGRIALQSEGSETRFRRLQLRELADSHDKVANTAECEKKTLPASPNES